LFHIGCLTGQGFPDKAHFAKCLSGLSASRRTTPHYFDQLDHQPLMMPEV
jgi:hypothetical protein